MWIGAAGLSFFIHPAGANAKKARQNVFDVCATVQVVLVSRSDEEVPDVDFIVSMLDRPYCEIYPEGNQSWKIACGIACY